MGDGKFQSKVFMVTGGSSGIGRSTALIFAKEGATDMPPAKEALIILPGPLLLNMPLFAFESMPYARVVSRFL